MTSRLDIPTPGTWWQAIPAWPPSRDVQEYHSLRRVWADHTLAGARGVYRPNSEDHQTIALFQPFAALPAKTWFPVLAEALSLRPVKPKFVRIAFAHEENVPLHRQNHHGRDFVIADIVVYWRDDATDGLVSFEVKRQNGPGPTAKDFEKVRTYIEFDSMKDVAHRDAVFLVSDRHTARVQDRWPHVAAWSDVLSAQRRAATAVAAAYSSLEFLPSLIEDLFAAYHIGRSKVTNLPDPTSLFDAVSAQHVPPELIALATGLAYSAHWRRGNETVEVPTAFEWLHSEPTQDDIRAAAMQTTADRRVNRWSPNWSLAQEQTMLQRTSRRP